MTILSAELNKSNDIRLRTASHGVDFFANTVYQATQANPVWTTAQFQVFGQLGLGFGIGNAAFKANALSSSVSQVESTATSVLSVVGVDASIDVDRLAVTAKFATYKLDPAGDILALADIVRSYNSGNLLSVEQKSLTFAQNRLTEYGSVTVRSTPVTSYSPPLVY